MGIQLDRGQYTFYRFPILLNQYQRKFYLKSLGENKERFIYQWKLFVLYVQLYDLWFWMRTLGFVQAKKQFQMNKP